MAGGARSGRRDSGSDQPSNRGGMALCSGAEASQGDEENTLKVLIATDNHLGFEENDHIRGGDSFLAFEEVLKVAVERQVDMVVLGGDLFHENKPSRGTLVRCMRLFRKYVYDTESKESDGCKINVLNAEQVQRGGTHINFMDPCFKVGLPIFSIHGNHDDPTGHENLSAIDVMSTSNLLTYFGKNNLQAGGPGKVEVSPIIISKGNARLALYGLGYIRDERLNRMLNTPGNVNFKSPGSVGPVADGECFNLCMVHQTKQRSTAAKNFLNPGRLPHFLDLVVWGHEHECLITPQPATEAQSAFCISQPGSSVVTSLTEGEAKSKHIMLLHVRKDAWHPEEIPLRYTRPFAFRQVKLADEVGLAPDDEKSVEAFLEKTVDELIAKAGEQDVPDEDLRLPLVRVKVDYTNYSTINTQRFGQRFVGKVANPAGIFLFHKAAARRKGADPEEAGELVIRPEAQEREKIEKLVQKNLRDDTLVLPIPELTTAIHDFVEKEEATAITGFVRSTLDDTQEKLHSAANEISESNIPVLVKEFMKDLKSKRVEKEEEEEEEEGAQGDGDSMKDVNLETQVGKENSKKRNTNSAAGTSKKKPAKKATSKAMKTKIRNHFDDDEEEADTKDPDFDFTVDEEKELPASTGRKKPRATEATKRKRGQGDTTAASAPPAARPRRAARSKPVVEYISDSDE